MTVRIFAVFAGIMLLSVVSAATAQTAAPKDTPDVTALTRGGNEFTTDIYASLAGKDGNLFLSPNSIRTALAMTYAGAAGDTADEMAKTLHFTMSADKLHPTMAALIKNLNDPVILRDDSAAKPTPVYQLTVANALWGRKGLTFKKDFLDLTKQNYGAGLEELDFAKPDDARKTINDWVAAQTKDRIKDLIGPGVLDSSTQLVLTNAIYFKSNWAHAFTKEATADGKFKLSADKAVTVPMMHQTAGMGYMETDDFQALDMPYKQDALSMTVFLPKKADGLAAFEKTLTADNLTKWLGQIKNQQVKITLPKFTFADEFSLKDALVALGMKAAFDPARADFSGMTASLTTKEKLFISAVLHKAFVAVDEDGTEAAAATAVVMMKTGMVRPDQMVEFTADHPFVFVIRHKASGEILFIGRLANPKE